MIFEELTLLPEASARRMLAGTHALELHVLRPPFAAAGVGSLRVLRVKETAGGTLAIVAGYDNYERLEDKT